MKGILLAVLLLLCWNAPVQGAVVGEEIKYSNGGVSMTGYLAYDDSIKEKRPGILIVHEWWGHNEYVRKRGAMLAQLGYTALALDMYGDGKTAEHPGEAGKFAAEVRQNLPIATERFKAAMKVLEEHNTVNPEKIAAIGYCFGGGIVLQMARQGLDLDAVVSFHGSLATDAPAGPGDVKARILVCHGAEDKLVPAEQVESFKREMKNAGADYRFISYPNAQHSFTNPEADTYAEKFNIPVGYNSDADKKSWQDMQDFLKEVFAQ